MAEDKSSKWTHGLAINLFSNLIAAIVGVTVTYLSHDGSAWVKPLLCGGAAWLITFSSILAFRISKNLPSARPKPVDANNVQHKIRDWLDDLNLTVQNVTSKDSTFQFIVTTRGGKKVSISKNEGRLGDYISIRGLIVTTDEEKAKLATFTDEELQGARLSIQLELSRAVMGYTSEKDVLEDITIFKQVPITSSLNEQTLFNAIWEVEAMLGTIFIMGALAGLRNSIRNKNTAVAKR